MICSVHVICFLVALHLVGATIEVFDRFGRKVDTFQDREAAFDDDFVTMEGYVVSADPPDACKSIAPPTFLTNFTMGKFVLINGTSECGLTTKVRNAEKAGYDVAIMYMPFEYIHIVPFPILQPTIEVLFVSYEDGIILRSNYVYNNSYEYNYRVRIRPNTPDITYYMYLFGAVIGVCFFVMLLFMMCLLIKCIQEKRRSRRNRLSSRQIKQIPTAKFSKGDQYDVCAICLEDYNEGDKLRILPCSHAYHAKCIDPWLMNNRRNCPLCKRKITFGESDESDSEDSELTSPAENTPLLTSPSNRSQSWGTFGAASTSNQPDGSGPSSLPGNYQQFNAASSPESDTSSENHFLSADESENLLPPSHHSVNNPVPYDRRVVIAVNLAGNNINNDAENDQRGLIV
ncbi:E3 ubiquitin-protein ligase RNF13-like [Argiope bruennichi]|uniref:E3 ubiquitin-protein ligase RNF13 like protein n=1 Tax=Argiope bruennichi TaxID=94029 RepID=A0A8T0E795_ARGBR|nr:E3 ubiquitin-protein ligase RNF13-like [Argiope bruennichi]KAF8765074.1 E3 ubiquitin-protein ligase RNF13 like protein [Argiope bruennichi]